MTMNLSRRAALTVGAGGLLAALGSTAAAAAPPTETELRRGRREGLATVYRIANQGWTLKSFPNPEEPQRGSVIVDATHAAAFEQWEIGTNGTKSTIRNHVTWLYAYGESNQVITISDEGIDPTSLAWEIVQITTGVFAIRVPPPGPALYWTVDGHSITLTEWASDVTQLFSLERV
ncbi:hypothetical protein ACFVT2_39390 [Streptomyces sp. NPDC058000]|uniref:RICIN domain-containing protein n=1 Tax=Streptomyces sp. NPDC058000 TaxID=3346299 RepID=UPI0036EC2CA2